LPPNGTELTCGGNSVGTVANPREASYVRL
jgi:hypothetical protein